MNSSPTGLPKGKKMHQCDFCDRFFSTASNMREHRRTHTGEKPFVCRYCGKAFAQSSTHSKHQLVHKTKEKLRSDSRGGSVKQIDEQDPSDPSLARLAVSSKSQFSTEQSLPSSKMFIKPLQEQKQSEIKMEVDFYDNLDWCNSNSVLGRQVDSSLQFNNIRDAEITPAPLFNRAKNNEQRSFADQKPIITGMFKNRACEFSPFAENKNLQVKQEVLDVKDINSETSSFLTELSLSGNKDPIQYENAKNETLDVPPSFLREANTINCNDSKAFHSALTQPVSSKGINRDDQWNGSREVTSIIELDLTSEGEDTLPETQDKFQSNIETFFKCIHCSETFSSLEEHICLAKEAKMFFKCQTCQKTFAQYGPFVRHKQTHESPKQFVVSSSSDISPYKASEYKKCDGITADNVRKESNDLSSITESLHLRQVKDANCGGDLLASSLPLEPSRIQSNTSEEEQSSNDDVIIIEDTVQAHSRHEDVLENLATSFSFGSNGQPESFLDSLEKNQCSLVKKNKIIEIPDSLIESINSREKLSTIPTYANTDRFNNTEGGHFERSNLSIADVGKSQRGPVIPEALLKSVNVVEKKIGNTSLPEKQQAHSKQNPLQIGKRGHPFTCLFCPRKFSTASNMREHMRIHTGEKPFSCELCHKKFAQSSTRSKHMQTHTGYKMSGYHFYGKKFTLTKNYKKHLRKPGKHHENPKFLLPNKFASIKEKPKVHPIKSSSMKAPCNKSYSSLPYSKANRLSLKKYAFRMLPEPSSNFSFPPKTANNKMISLTARLEGRDGVSNDNIQFGYNKEGINRTNVSNRRTDRIMEHNNNQNSKNKISFSSTARSDSHISVFGSSSLENSKPQFTHLPPSTTSTVLPRPKSRHRGAHRLLRNARSYRPFRCTYCPRTFSTSGNMKEHMRTHTGEKPFRCEYCHRRFAQSSTHSKHVQIHIRKQQLNCFFCGKFFSQVALLRNHIIMDHKTAAGNSTRTNNNKSNNLSANLCTSSSLGMVSGIGTSCSFGSNGQAESFLNSVEKSQCSQEAKVKKNEIIEIPDSSSENVSNYEVDSSLTEKRHLEVDVPANYTGFLIHGKDDSFLSLQVNGENKTSPEKNQRKKDLAEIPKISKDALENAKSCVAEDSKSDLLSSSFAETACVRHQSDSEMFGELLTQHAWHATSTKARIQQQQQQSQIKSGSPCAFELPYINSELSSNIESESSKSLAKDDANFYSEMKPLDSSSPINDLNATKSFRMNEELSNSTISGEKMVDKIFLNDYSYQNQFINLSSNEILENCTDSNQKKPTKLQIGSPHNIGGDNLVHYDQTVDNLDVELPAKRNTDTGQSKVGMYDNSFLDKRNKLQPQKEHSHLLKSDQSSSSPKNLTGCFTPPVLTNNNLADHFPAKAQICTINKVRNEALHSLGNRQGNDTFGSSQVTSYEQFLRSKISLELASNQIERSLYSNGSVPDHKTMEQNVPELLNSEPSPDLCSGDPTKKLNVDWLSEIVPKTKSENEEMIIDFVENCNSKILSSKMENSVEEGSVAVLSKCIKLEKNVFEVDTEHGLVTKDALVQNAANSDMTIAVSVGDSLDSSCHFNISNITANVQYSVTTKTDRNEKVADNSRSFCHPGETISADGESAFDTSLVRISSSESTSVYTDPKNQQLPLNGTLLNNVETISMAHLEKRRKNLQRYKIAGKFKCIYCNRCFSTRSNMREHMRIHTGEKPFECVFCFRRFAQSSTHSKHVQTHLRFRQLMCPQCGRRFSRASNLCQHIRIHHRISPASATSLAKKMSLRSDPVVPTTPSSNNKDKHLFSADLSENNRGTVNVHEVSSFEPSEIYKQTKTQNEAIESICKLSPFLDNEQINKEMSDDLLKIPTQLILSKGEKRKSAFDIDFEKNNFPIDINFPTSKETTESQQDVSFDTINSNLNQNDLPLGRNVLPERNNDAKFSSFSPSPSVCPVSVIEPMKEPKKSLMLYFHRCLFCCKMFDVLINVQECLGNHVKEDEPSRKSKYKRKIRECSTWYKHVEIVLGDKLRLPTKSSVGNVQHLKIKFDVGERLKMMLHRNLYKCRKCHKECATFQSLLFHRRIHTSKLTGQKLPALVTRKLNKRTQVPSSFKKRPTSSLIFSLEPISPNNGRNPSAIGNDKESHKVSLPLLCFSLKNQFWLVNSNGNLKALGSYSRGSSVDESPSTEIVSCELNVTDSLQQKSNKNSDVFCSEEKSENAGTTNKCISDDKSEKPLHFSLNDLEDDTKIDLNADDSEKNEEVVLGQDTQSLNNSGAMKLFGQEVTTMVSLQLQQCVDCGKMLSHVGHFEKHSLIHKGKLLFQCNFCLKSFTSFSTFSRHKNLIHLRRNRKTWIPSCRKSKSSCNVDRKTSDSQENVELKGNQTELQSTLDVNLADVDTAYLANLLKKVLGSKSAEVFSDSPFVDKLPNGESTKLSEMMEFPSRLSDKQLTESSINLSSQSLQSEESDSNVCVIGNFQPEIKESVDEINFVQGDDSNETVRGICATDIFPAKVQIKNEEEEENFSVLDKLKVVDKSETSVERKADIFSYNWQGEVSEREVMFSSQPSHNAQRQVNLKRDSDEEPQMNSREGNDSRGFNEKNLKEDALVECIFINDDPDDRSQDECCILGISSSSNRYSPNRNEMADTANEIIVLSDEENDISSHVETKSFNDGNSMIKLCDRTDEAFLNRPKENRIENQSKADSKPFQDIYKSVDILFENCESSFPEISGQNCSPNLNDGLGTVSMTSTTSPLLISNSATNSLKMTDFSTRKTLQPQSRGSLSSKVHPCLFCSKICSSSSNLKEHMRSHTGERPFSCVVCHKTFAQKSTLSKHTQIHTRFGKLSPVGVTTQTPSGGYHESVEPTPINPLKSPLGLVGLSSLAKRLKIKPVSNINIDPKHATLKSSTNLDSREKINADVCDSFNLIDKMRSDINQSISFESDRPNKRQSSEIVGNQSPSCYPTLASSIYPHPQSSAKVLTCKPILMKSNPIKPGTSDVVPENNVPNKPYSCDVCDRTFTTSGNLKEHRRTHTGERPFECPFCDKTFVQASTRSRHVKNHSKHIVNHF